MGMAWLLQQAPCSQVPGKGWQAPATPRCVTLDKPPHPVEPGFPSQESNPTLSPEPGHTPRQAFGEEQQKG